jgi:uncharacterized cupin superfamily protein
MSTVATSKIYRGSTSPELDSWEPFEWEEPGHGKLVHGEISMIIPEGTSGSLMAGLWRTHAAAPGANADGSHTIPYSSPLGDEMLVVIEGTATVTVNETGEKHRLEPGVIMCHPKNLELTWEVDGPYFKKYWVIWDSPQAATPRTDLLVGNINDNPAEWETYRWTEPVEGDQVCGELYFMRQDGTTGTRLCGIWRSGVGIDGCEADGSSTIPYTATLGDETLLLLEGTVHIRDDVTGEEHDLHSGDVVTLPHGHHLTWTSQPPFVKKFWVITKDQLPEPAAS